MWQWLLLVVILLPMTIKDMRSRHINGYICLVATLFAMIVRLNFCNDKEYELIFDLFPGLFLLLFSKCTAGVFGSGDALVILFIGSVVGVYSVLAMLVFSVMLSGLICLILYVLKKVNRNTEIPFLPFLSLGVLAGGLI